MTFSFSMFSCSLFVPFAHHRFHETPQSPLGHYYLHQSLGLWIGGNTALHLKYYFTIFQYVGFK